MLPISQQIFKWLIPSIFLRNTLYASKKWFLMYVWVFTAICFPFKIYSFCFCSHNLRNITSRNIKSKNMSIKEMSRAQINLYLWRILRNVLLPQINYTMPGLILVFQDMGLELHISKQIWRGKQRKATGYRSSQLGNLDTVFTYRFLIPK